MIQAAIFDMDGLLIDSEPLWWEAQVKVLKKFAITPTHDDLAHILGTGLPASVRYWYHKNPWSGASLPDVERQIAEELLALFKQKGRLLPGVAAVLDLLEARKLPLAVASSTPQWIVDQLLADLKITKRFQAIYSAEHETHSKPHPGVFISAAKLLKVEPQHCLVFEDAPAGVLAAKAARMPCVAVPDPKLRDHSYIQTADIILKSMTEFDAAMLDSL